MDRGVPTEAVLAEMRTANPPVQYLVGTPKGRLTRLEKAFVDKPWQDARPGVQVKLLPQDGELYVFAQSADRVAKERAIRRRQLKWLWARLKQLAGMKLTREELLMRLGAARKQARTAWRLLAIAVAKDSATFSYRLDRQSCAGPGGAKAAIYHAPISPMTIRHGCGVSISSSSASRKRSATLKGISPFARSFIRTRRASRRISLSPSSPIASTSRSAAGSIRWPPVDAASAIEKFAAVQMIDPHVPTTDGRELLLTRYTEPEPELELLLHNLKFALPDHQSPKSPPCRARQAPRCSADLSC